MSNLIDNPIFLLRRWRRGLGGALWLALSIRALAGQSTSIAFESPHFRIIAPAKESRRAEKILSYLERVRQALIDLHGSRWIAPRPVRIWIPPARKDFQRIAQRPTEQGLYVAGPRLDWITGDPSSAHLEQVLGHEYLHAVLGPLLAEQPAWLIEGLCEYYSTLAYEQNGSAWRLLLGRAPGTRLLALRNSTDRTRARLEASSLDSEGYAWAWAYVHRMAEQPNWQDYLRRLETRSFNWADAEAALGFLPQPLARDPFAERNIRPPSAPPRLLVQRLDAVLTQELEAEARLALDPAEPGPRATEEAQEVFLQGLRLFDQGQAAAARPLLEEACRLRPSQSSWWLSLAAVYEELQLLEDQKKAVQQALATAVTVTERDAALAAQRQIR